MIIESKLDLLLKETLKEAGSLKPATLGPSEMLSLGKEGKKKLLTQMTAQVKFLNKIIVSIVVLHFLIFLLASFLVFYWRDFPDVILYLLGGSVLSLMVIIRSLVGLVKTKGKMDCILITLPNLSAEQALIMIQSVYFEGKKTSRSSTLRAPGEGAAGV